MIPNLPRFNAKHKEYIITEKMTGYGFNCIGYTPVLSKEERYQLEQNTARIGSEIVQKAQKTKAL